MSESDTATETKYSVPDDHWDEDQQDDERDSQHARVKAHDVEVVLTTDPDADMGYGREKWTARLQHDDGDVYCLYAVEHRWKGNYWRDVTRWDWCDVPAPVRARVAAVVDCDGPDDLEPGVRVIGEGGESTWTNTPPEADDAE